jgi:hypothetical protein
VNSRVRVGQPGPARSSRLEQNGRHQATGQPDRSQPPLDRAVNSLDGPQQVALTVEGIEDRLQRVLPLRRIGPNTQRVSRQLPKRGR